MVLDDDDSDLIFLLEVIVNSITLADTSNDTAKSPLIVGVRFIGHPLMDIRQDEFSQALTAVKHDVFTCGKSCLFPIVPRNLLAGIEENPLVLTVYRQLPDILGRADIDLSECMGEMIRGVIKSPGEVPVARFLKGVYSLVDANKKTAGAISLFVRLSCLGETILSPVQILEEQTAYLFKNTMVDSSKKTSQFREDTERPQPSASGSRSRSRSRLTKELDGDIATASLPIMYSLDEARCLCNVGPDGKTQERNTGDCGQLTLKHIVYELNKIGTTEQSPLQDSTCQAATKVPCEEPVFDEGDMMYKLSDFQNVQDVNGIPGDVQVTREEAQDSRPLYYCTLNEGLTYQQKDSMQEGGGFSRGSSRQAALPAQHLDVPAPGKHAATTCACNEGNARRPTPQMQMDVFPRAPAAPSCACDCAAPGHGVTTTAQQPGVPEGPRTTCRCDREGAGVAPTSPAAVCCPSAGERSTRGGGGAVVWRMPDGRRCRCCSPGGPGGQEHEETGLSRTPPHAPARYDTTDVLSAAHNHPPVRYDTTGVLSPAAGLYGGSPAVVAPAVVAPDVVAPAVVAPAVVAPDVVDTDVVAPAVVVPAGVVPAVVAPDVVAPAVVAPAVVAPDVVVPAGVVPAGVVPAGVVPAGVVPAGVVPAGVVPAGVVPAVVVPAGVVPAGVVPAVVVPAGVVPAAVAPGEQAAEGQGALVQPPAAASAPCTHCTCCCDYCTTCPCRVRMGGDPPRKCRSFYGDFRPDPGAPPRGHKCDYAGTTRVPPNMGWFWTHSSLAKRRGWRPGYIPRAVQRRMREAAQGLSTAPLAAAGRRGQARHRAKARSTAGSKTRLLAARDAGPTMHVVQRDGSFYVTLVDQEQPGEPVKFRVPGCGDAGSAASEHNWPRSARSSDIHLEFMSPADLAPLPEPAPASRSVGVQFDERDLPPPAVVAPPAEPEGASGKPPRPRKKRKK